MAVLQGETGEALRLRKEDQHGVDPSPVGLCGLEYGGGCSRRVPLRLWRWATLVFWLLRR